MSETPTTPPLTTTEEPKGNKRTYLGKEYDITEPRFQGLSKNQIKKILKEELWQESKADRTKEKRAKHKRKRAERQQLVKEGVLEPLPKRPKSKYMTVGNVGVVLDCSFSHLMNEKEISSMRQQICRCYSANVRAEKTSMQITLTSLDEPLEQIMDEKAPSWRNWRNFEATKESFVDKLSDKKEDLIYLSADSDNVAYELEDNKTYIIGGIVDKNRHKNLCNNKANEHNIKTAQLPIGDYIKMATRKVLTVNQVFEIMIKWLDCRDWEKAFLEVIPDRKLKDSTVLNRDGEEEEEEEEEDLEDLEEDDIVEEET